MLTTLLNIENEYIYFIENLGIGQHDLKFYNHSFLFHIDTLTDYNLLSLSKDDNMYTKSLITFINQTEDAAFFTNLENTQTIYHYSIPNTKLAYPEPFIASASLMHNDLWFVHILVYQYWLWFIFVFIIIFFFIGFIITVRWCNMRVRPRRETRGVSRSKCGDLVTAIVPVSWAASIIINESTDAIDYYDGFGTTEMVVGIRAYQWGWEYYYPKDLDLNYNIKHNFSSFVGNSLKYNTTTEANLRANNPWRFYQNKPTDQVITPAHLLILPLDNYKLLNFFNFNDIGANALNETNAFKKIRTISKTCIPYLFYTPGKYTSKYKTLSSMYISPASFTDSYLYGYKRQHNFVSSKSVLNNFSTFLNMRSVDKIFNFNWHVRSNICETFTGVLFANYFKQLKSTSLVFDTVRFNSLINSLVSFNPTSCWNKLYFYPSIVEIINNDSDKKKIHQPIYKLFNLPSKKFKLNHTSVIANVLNSNDITSTW